MSCGDDTVALQLKPMAGVTEYSHRLPKGAILFAVLQQLSQVSFDEKDREPRAVIQLLQHTGHISECTQSSAIVNAAKESLEYEQ